MRSKRVLGLICVAFTLFLLNQGALTFAEGSTEFSIDVSSAALQLTVPPTASIELNPTTSSAVFGSANVTINVATNNITGYRIIMSVPSTNLTHNSLSNTVIPTLSAASTESNFPANAWGYKVVGDDYEPILTSNTPASWVVEEPTNGTNHIMTLAAKVDGTKPSGNYTNTLTFQAVATPNAYRDTIVFNGNGADGGSMENQLVYQGEPTRLTANTYTKTGYLFNGWNKEAAGGWDGYGDEESFTSTISSTSKTITLYAQWLCDNSVNTCEGVPSADGSGGYHGKTLQDAYEQAYVRNEKQTGNYYDTNANRYKKGLYVPHKTNGVYDGTYFEATVESDYAGIPANDLRFAIQDIDMTIDSVKICDYATVIGSSAYVLDLRDFTSYHVVKAADGRCWMQDNLALDPLASGVVMSSTNTNATDAAITSFLSRVVYATAFSINTVPYVNSSKKNVIPNDSRPVMRTLVQEGKWKAGVYYNFCAVSAGTFCVNPWNVYDKNPDSAIDVENDICPAGWRLPTGGSIGTPGTTTEGGGEFQIMADAYPSLGSNDTTQYLRARKALHLPQSGYNHSSDGIIGHGDTATFWSSTYHDQFGMHALYFDSSNFNSTAALHSNNGATIRCVAK